MNKKGLSLVELIVVMAIFVIVIGIPYKLFIQQLKTTVREVGLSQSSIEQLPALEIMRKDIEMAGFGLPWNIGSFTYNEAKSSVPDLYSFDKDIFNDSTNNPPRAMIVKTDTTKNKFSYLVLKATIFGLNKAAYHWTYIDKNNRLNIWPAGSSANYNNIATGDRVIVMEAGKNRKLVGDSLYYQITKNAATDDTNPSDYGLPGSLPSGVYLVYGIGRGQIIAPFNRIDYYLYKSSNSGDRCASGTYTLGRSILRQSDGSITPYPILNCVADFQVVFGLDTNGDGIIDKWTQDTTTMLPAAEDVREQLKQVRVYLLVQNGVRDINYNYPYTRVSVGENLMGKFYGRVFDLTKINDFRHYRWKVIKLVITPKNLE